MLSDIEIEELFARLGTPDRGCALVRAGRSGLPSREPNSRLGNCIVDHYSPKMGGNHLRLGSRTVEEAAARLYELDDEVLEFWPQPFGVELMLIGEHGRTNGRVMHWPDFLVITKSRIAAIEWREESRLNKLAQTSKQFTKDESGCWHYLPAEQCFSALGIAHETHSAIELPRTLIDNAHFLGDFQKETCPGLPEPRRDLLARVLDQSGHLEYLELVEQHHFTADEVFRAIVEGVAYADLKRDRLDSPLNLLVFRDATYCRAHKALGDIPDPPLPFPGMSREIAPGTVLRYSGKQWMVLLVGAGQVLLLGEDGQRVSLELEDLRALPPSAFHDAPSTPRTQLRLADLSMPQLAQATKRLEMLTAKSDEVSARTRQRWAGACGSAVSNVERLVLLAGGERNRGNRVSRLDSRVVELATTAIKQFHNTPTARTALGTYQQYQLMCEREGLHGMSYVTFCKHVRGKRSIVQRDGKRMAYSQASIPLYLDYRHPLHGMFPHDVCYMDHTVLNLATAGTKGEDLGKPTFSVAIDGHTTKNRAYWVSYDPPSAKVVLLVLRDYVRRNGRLPGILIVDGGREFRSWELKFFCKLFGIDLRHRPAGRPRGGSPVERAMGYTETELIAQLEGNTRAMKNARMVTKSVNPFRRREWTLTALFGALDEFFRIRDARVHSTLGVSPDEYEKQRIRETGQRSHCVVPFDENLMLATCPHTKKRFHKIDRQRGVWADGQFYWHEAFRDVRVNEQVEVRYEPWSSCVVYVHYRGVWLPAISRNLKAAPNATHYEFELQLRAERRLAKVNGNKARLSRKSASEMTGLWDPARFDPRIRAQQQEALHLAKRLGMAFAIPLPELKDMGDAKSEGFAAPIARTPAPILLDRSDEEPFDADNAVWGEDSEFI